MHHSHAAISTLWPSLTTGSSRGLAAVADRHLQRHLAACGREQSTPQQEISRHIFVTKQPPTRPCQTRKSCRLRSARVDGSILFLNHISKRQQPCWNCMFGARRLTSLLSMQNALPPSHTFTTPTETLHGASSPAMIHPSHQLVCIYPAFSLIFTFSSAPGSMTKAAHALIIPLT